MLERDFFLDKMQFLNLVILGLATLAQGFILWLLWGWFIRPLGLPGLSLGGAVGVTILWMWAKPRGALSKPEKKEAPESWEKAEPILRQHFEEVWGGLQEMILVLVFGWVAHFF